MNKIKLIMSCEDPNYKITMSQSPNSGRFGDRGANFAFGDQMQTKVNFFGESLEVPLSHSYST